ncbi:MAG: DUF6531 domain-containing protein [Coriobacteriia bacterium]|nr:DUF6531 domain-containing protein [Coriobacteriia bacterium]
MHKYQRKVALFLVAVFVWSLIPAPAIAAARDTVVNAQKARFNYPEIVTIDTGERTPRDPQLRAPKPDVDNEESEREFGPPVEVHEFEKVYQTGPRSYRSVFSQTPNTYKDRNGSEHEIDNTLIEKDPFLASPYLTNAANSYDVRIPLEITERRPITYTKDGFTIELAPLSGDYSTPVALDNAVLYNNVYEHMDVEYLVRETGVKESIIYNAHTDITSFSYALKAPSNLSVMQAGNTIEMFVPGDVSGEDEPLFVITAPYLFDANGAVSTDATMTLSGEGISYRVDVEIDEQWLSDPVRVFPVVLDPTVQTYVPTYVSLNEMAGRAWLQEHGYVGYVTEGVSGVVGGYLGRSRLILGPTDAHSSIPSVARIDKATLRMYQYKSMFNGAQFGAYRIRDPYDIDSITWAQATGLNREIAGSDAIRTSMIGWQNFDITEAVKYWNEGLAPNYGIMITPLDEWQEGGVFITPGSWPGVAGQGNMTTDMLPCILVDWIVPDPVSLEYPLNNTTIHLYPHIESHISGRLRFHGVLPAGVARPESIVRFALSDTSKGYTGNVQTSYSLKFPDSQGYEGNFPVQTTKYRDKLGNWQAPVPFTNFTFNDRYRISARATIDGVNFGTTRQSEEFVVYRVQQYDTLQKIANWYGIPINQIAFDNRVQDMLLVENNTLFIRNPQRNANNPYNPPPLDDEAKRRIDSMLMGRGLHCEFGFEPINLNTGNFFMEASDIVLDTGDDFFALNRTYNSKRSRYNSVFGRGWEFEYSQSLSRRENGNITYVRGDGSVVEFERTSDLSYRAPEGYHLTLTPIEVGTKNYTNVTRYTVVGDPWYNNYAPTIQTIPYPVYEYEIVDGADTAYRFSSAGMLKSVTNVRGEATTLEHDANGNITAIISPTGLVYSVQTTADGKIEVVTLPSGGTLRYVYNTLGDLVSYLDALGNTTHYRYDTDHRMISWSNGNGEMQIENVYDDEGRIIEQIDGNGGVSYLYYTIGSTVTIDAEGNKVTYHYDDQYRTLKVEYEDGTQETNTYENNLRASSTDRGGFTTHYEYDSNGNVTREVRFDGAARTYTYNEFSQLTQLIDFDGYTTEYIYDGAQNLIELIVAGTRQMSYTYDDKHRVLTQTDANGNVTAFTYEGLGKKPKTRTDAAGNTTTFFYDSMQQLTAVEDPLGNVSRIFYDQMGLKTGVQNATGATERYEFDAGSNLVGIVDANDDASTYSFDALGNMTRAADAYGDASTYTYDAVGNRIAATDADAHTTHFAYDAHGNITGITLPNGAVQTFSYDARDKVLETTDALGATTRYIYDERTGLTESITNELGATTTFEYSEVGLLLAEIDSTDARTSYEYDEKRQLIRMVEPDGRETIYHYDDVGNLTLEYDNTARVTSYTYNELNQLISVTDPLGNTTTYFYDVAGNLAESIDALGQVTRFAYDGAAQITALIDDLGHTVQLEYDALGNLAKTVDQLGHESSFTYDANNKMVTSTNEYGVTSTYRYSANEQLAEFVDPFGNSAYYTYNELGLTERIIDAHENEYHFEYDAAGNPTRQTSPNGATETREYDVLGRLFKGVSAAGLVTTHAYDSENRPIHSINSLGEEMTYEYDVIGNLITITDSYGRVMRYTYDRARNVVSVTEFDGNTIRYEYDLGDNLIKATDPLGVVTTYEYDAVGNLTSQVDDARRRWQYTYDTLGQLSDIKNPVGDIESFIYDAAGNITEHIDGKGNVRTIEYDVASQPIAEVDRRGNAATYTYDEIGRLIGQVAPDGGAQEYLYDALDNLVRVKDELNNVTMFEYDSVGNVTKTTQPTGAATLFDYDMSGNVVSKTDALDNVTTFSYDRAGRLTERIMPNEARYRYTYDLLGRLTQATSPGGLSKGYTYSARGDVIKQTDQAGRSVTYTYDTMHNVTSVTDALGHTSTYTYDKHSNLTSTLTPTGSQTRYSYDALDRLIGEVSPSGLSTRTLYDRAGNIERVTQTGGRTTNFAYDAESNITGITNALGHKRSFEYDVVGRLISETDALGKTKSYEYDARGQLLSILNERGDKNTFTYDANGNVTATRDARGVKIEYSYDKLDRLTKVKEDGADTSYTYDALDNLASITDGNGHTTAYTYDEAGNLASVTNPLGQTQAYAYDSAHRLSRWTQPDGSAITYDYDAIDRLTALNVGDEGSALYAYDADGQRTTMSDAHGATEYTYDEAGRMATMTTSEGEVVAYTYDIYSNLTELTYPDGTSVQYTYDALDRLISVIDRADGTTTYTYDGNDNVVRVVRANDTSAALEYDELDRIATLINHGADGSIISRFAYTYDMSGNILSERRTQNDVETWADYEYDGRAQLTKSTEITNLVVTETTYSYDGAGNRTRQEIRRAGSLVDAIDFTYDGADKLLETISTANGTTTYEYDERGNQISKTTAGSIEEYSYDTQNRLEAITRGGTLLFAALYDGDSNRVFTAQRNSDVHWQEITDASEEGTSTGSGQDTESGINRPSLWAFLYGFMHGLLPRFVPDPPHGALTIRTGWRAYEIANTTTYERVVDAEDGRGDTVFIPESVADLSRRDYEMVRYLNDTNTEYARTLVEYDPRGRAQSIFEYSQGLELLAHSSAGRETYAFDGRGSVAHTTDTQGRLRASYEYDVFGAATVTGLSTNPYTYNAERTDRTTGMQYLRARYYAPDAGRFITEDTYRGKVGDPLTHNQYAYVGNNPLLYNDPSGHIFGAVVNAVKKVATAVVTTVKKVVTTVVNTVVRVVNAVVNTVKNIYNAVVGGVQATWNGAKQAGATIVNGVVQGGQWFADKATAARYWAVQQLEVARRAFCDGLEYATKQAKNFVSNVDWARVGEGALKIGLAAVTVVGAVGVVAACIATGGVALPLLAAGAAGTAIAFSAGDAIAGVQDVGYGLQGNTATPALDPIKDGLFADNQDLYVGVKGAASVGLFVTGVGAVAAAPAAGEAIVGQALKPLTNVTVDLIDSAFSK